MRHEIDLLLLELWQDTRCRSCIKQQATTAAAAGGGGGLFASFVSAVLNDLMYLFKDSLERLADIKQIEDSKKDTKVRSTATVLDIQSQGGSTIRPLLVTPSSTQPPNNSVVLLSAHWLRWV